MVLLLAPLARAAVRGGHGLRDAVRVVLSETTVDDAVQVYAAVQRAHPGGMGTSPEQDLSHRPTLSLLEVMHLAAERDGVAREYATGFAVTFERGLPAIRAARERGGEWTDAAVECYLTILAATPDSLIARKCGRAVAEQVSERARQVLEAGNWTSDAGRRARELFDADLRDPQNSRNPGTTADLTAAALFVALIEAGGP
jgi:triphosphoribosyl-dephospho-CoA synthase